MRRDDGRIDKQVEFRLHTELLSFIKPALAGSFSVLTKLPNSPRTRPALAGSLRFHPSR